MTYPLQVYVAGSSAEPERVAWAMDALRVAGVEITLDWREVWRPTASMTWPQRHDAARADLRAIRAADVTWVLAPGVRSDALVETGLAIAGGHRVIVSGPLAQRGIFAAAAEEYDTDEDALDAILHMRPEAP